MMGMKWSMKTRSNRGRGASPSPIDSWSTVRFDSRVFISRSSATLPFSACVTLWPRLRSIETPSLRLRGTSSTKRMRRLRVGVCENDATFLTRAGEAGALVGTMMGIVKVIFVPTPTSLSTISSPPSALTVSSLMYKPSPIPPPLLAADFTYGCNAALACSFVMPLPVSSTVKVNMVVVIRLSPLLVVDGAVIEIVFFRFPFVVLGKDTLFSLLIPLFPALSRWYTSFSRLLVESMSAGLTDTTTWPFSVNLRALVSKFITTRRIFG
mmetsp:Transcript_42930/g.110833  ORF Transcript_42930/g.110833 Transcript_42930/m.110833 type:complete len:267 (-) Transcript_42930:2047-2847(-)